jgi:hypothetical protein
LQYRVGSSLSPTIHRLRSRSRYHNITILCCLSSPSGTYPLDPQSAWSVSRPVIVGCPSATQQSCYLVSARDGGEATSATPQHLLEKMGRATGAFLRPWAYLDLNCSHVAALCMHLICMPPLPCHCHRCPHTIPSVSLPLHPFCAAHSNWSALLRYLWPSVGTEWVGRSGHF